MLISLDWLKDYVDIDCSIDELCAKLVSAGFEVEEVIHQADNCKCVVVGRIDKLEPHPDADKLQICQINIGSEMVQIVTGATNVSEGDLVPAALDGSDLPNGMHIKKGKLRGVPSNGMLCSGEELNLKESDYPGAGVYGIMLLQGDIPLGTDINDVIGTNDTILDVGITANRPDCNSVFGIAREVATVLNKPIKMPSLKYETIAEETSDFVSVGVKNKEFCQRYMASVVKNIVIKESPSYIKRRLKAVGIRPINNIVDITNYVLMEIGQPMHAFDRDLVKDGKIVVRWANDGEQIKVLDGKTYTLDSTMGVIADGEKASAIAGIMGGEYSGINDNTKTIIFESARFARDVIRRTSRKLNLRSDSSARFERGIDFGSQEIGIKRALQLISETNSGDICEGIIDVSSSDLSAKQVIVPTKKINDILGIKVPTKDMVRILNSLQIKTLAVPVKDLLVYYRDDCKSSDWVLFECFKKRSLRGYECSRKTAAFLREYVKDIDSLMSKLMECMATNKLRVNSKVLICIVPLYRDDIENANDLAEEIIRLYGYDHIVCTLIDKGKQTIGGKTVAQTNVDNVKALLIGEGMNETYTYSFTTPKLFDMLEVPADDSMRNTVNLLNPLGEDVSIMRTTLMHSMIEILAKNINRGNKQVKFFEFANVYLPKALPLTEQPNEVQKLALGMYGEGVDFYDIKGVIENIIDYYGLSAQYVRQNVGYLHPGISANAVVDGKVVATFGEVRPDIAAKYDIKTRVYVAELDIDLLNSLYDNSYEFKPVSKFPTVNRDLAIVVEESVCAEQILDTVRKYGSKALSNVSIFDIYRGKGIAKGYKSVAISMEFTTFDKTMTDDDITTKMNKIIKMLEKELQAKLR